jgi:hypothetical protein
VAARTALLSRLLALALCTACVLAIFWIARNTAPDTSVAATGEDCTTRKRAEIEAEKTAGRLTAEQAMIRRQNIKAECG